ncbi:DUF4374 domain-containing protein [uncultured Bacteroides sp.]|uniref:DUF4374 domain-containing protein n=1 Tax=uncultured Bacteroides sp. TaxID=162156 RepID=UPI0025D751B9|nr:DUF4374 domain-containing protein [uncultured Bacteroides sp.]
MEKKFLQRAFTAALCLSGSMFAASCDGADVPANTSSDNGKTAYVVAATVGETSYLLTANSLDEGTVSTEGNGTEVIGGTYWVYKGLDYVFALVYNKGGAGTGASYYLGTDGKMKERYTYTYNRITSYGTWRDKVVTVSTGDSKLVDDEQNIAQALLFNYLDATDGSQEEGTLIAENFLGNGEKVTWAGLVEANNRIYTSVIPMGMSRYSLRQWPDKVTDSELITKTDGGSGSSAYTAGVIPSTQYPDNAYVAIYNGADFNEPPVIATTDKIGYACGRMRSQYYQTIWAADNGDVYLFSSGYGRTAVSSGDLKKVTGKNPSGVVRIKAGETDFDPDYYVNFEETGTGHPVFRCWPISGDYFLLQLYRKGVDDMINGGKNADVSELAVFKAEDKTIIPVTGLPADGKFGGEPYGENGYAYMAVSVTTGEKPAFYKIDTRTGKAVKGLTVEADAITTVGKMKPLLKQ